MGRQLLLKIGSVAVTIFLITSKLYNITGFLRKKVINNSKMKKAPVFDEESKRLDVLHSKQLVNTESDPRFDEITKLAVEKLKMPISTVSIIDEDTEYYKSCIGLDVQSGPREISFCGHALVENDLLVCEDTFKDISYKFQKKGGVRGIGSAESAGSLTLITKQQEIQVLIY
jgi:hypothetical protein